MALVFTTTKAEAQTRGIKVLVHSRAGFGKTTLCKTAPDPIILSAEAGLLSLGDADIPVILVRNFAELEEAYQFLSTSPHAKQFKTGCIDSLSEIAELCLNAEMARAGKDPRKAYGEMQNKVIEYVKKFRDLPNMNIYFSCKQEAIKDEITNITTYGPKAPGKQVGPALPYLFDEVFSLEIGRTTDNKEYRFLRTRASIQYEAKDRSGKLDEIERPDLTYIFNKIRAA